MEEFTLDNGSGLRLCAINLGGIVTALQVPDRDGVAANIVLGLASLRDYATRNPHLGTIVGRYANRLAHCRFAIDGEVFQLHCNDGPHALHGGPQGFGSRWWDIEPAAPASDGSVGLVLRLRSEDGDQGFPGCLDATVRYTLTAQQCWRIDYTATCERSTVVNLSHHDYFNLAGGGDIRDHWLTIAAGLYCPVDATLIPEGIAPVAATPFDFRTPMPVGQRLCDPHPQLRKANGYDHNWVLDDSNGPGLHFAARLEHPESGRSMEIHTDQPGLQFYSGNFLDGTLVGSAGQALRQHGGLCLETQHFPDAPNQPAFAQTVLRPGEVFASSTEHRFGLCMA